MAGSGTVLDGPDQSSGRTAGPGARSFPELNLRTYVRDQHTGTPGMYFLSLDANNLLAVGWGALFYRLPYHWAEMHLEQRTEREFSFYSRRRLASRPRSFQRALPRVGAHAQAGVAKRRKE